MPLISIQLLDLSRSSRTKMNNLHFLLLGVCIFLSGVFTDDTSMLDVVIKECNFSKVFNTSLIDTLRNETEFMECKNWSDITSIKSSEQFAENNLNNIRCLLYHESLVPVCKNESYLEKIYDFLIATPKYKLIEDFCENILLSESQTIRNVITNKNLCEHLCTEYQHGEPILNMICVKSYTFIKFLQEVKQSQISSTVNNKSSNENIPEKDDLGSKEGQNDVPTDVSPVESAQKQSDTGPAQKEGNQEVVLPVEREEKLIPNAGHNHETKAVPVDSIDTEAKEVEQTNIPKKGDQLVPFISPSPQKPEVIENPIPAQKNVKKGDTLSANQNEVQSNVFKPAANDLVPPSNNDLTNLSSKSSTVPADQEKPKDNLDTANIDVDNEQQGPPKSDDINMAPGEDYDFEQEKTEQFNQPKKNDVLVDVDPDADDAVADSDKMPKVSQLSDRFGYDGDIDGNSNFFTYFSFTCVIFVIGYVVYHNKTKVLALLVEGRHSRRTQRVRRPNIANYQKLDCNLEEAITSSVSKNSSHVIY